MRLSPFPQNLSPSALQQLSTIEPVAVSAQRAYPCALRLDDGEFIPCAYVIPYSSLRHQGQGWIPAGSVRQISPSPYRLPAKFANEIRRAGETGNGFYVFTVHFACWRRRAYVTTLIDFLRYPLLTGPASVREVVPHQGLVNRSAPVNDLKVRWCVYSDD